MEKRKEVPRPFPINPGMEDRAMTYCLIENQKSATPWCWGCKELRKLYSVTIKRIVKLRTDGTPEQQTIEQVRRFVEDRFLNAPNTRESEVKSC